MNLQELFVSMGFKIDDKDLTKTQGKLDKIVSSSLALKVALTAAAYGIGKMITSTINGTAELEKFSQTAGISIEKLRKWQEAGQKIDLTLNANSIAGSIAALQKNLDEIKLGRGDIGAFNVLGIEIAGKDAFAVLESLRERLQTMNISNSTAKNLLSRMGLDPSFISLLKTTRTEFEKLGNQIELTGNQRAGLLDLGKNLTTMKLNLVALKNQFSATFAPIINNVLKGLLNLYNNNSQAIIKTIKTVGDVFSRVTTVIGNAFSVISMAISGVLNLIRNTIGIENAFLLIGAAAVIMLKPFKPFTLALTAILLLLDDIAVWFAGGESLFSPLYDAIAKGIKMLQPFIDKFLTLKKALTFDGETATDGKPTNNIKQAIIGASDTAITGGLAGALAGSIIPGIGTLFGGLIGTLGGALVGLGKEGLKDFNIRNANPNTLSGLSIPSVSNANIQQNNEFQINITSADPQAVGEEISKNNAFQDVVNTVGTTYKNSIIK